MAEKSSAEVNAAQKFKQFTTVSLVGMKVEGIGNTCGDNMRRKGIDSATQIFGYFLALRGNQHEFKGYYKRCLLT